MPFAGFDSFDACVTAQKDKGHSEESARRICGALQAEAEGKSEEIVLAAKDAAALADVRVAGIVGARWAAKSATSAVAIENALEALDIDGLPMRAIPIGSTEAAALAARAAKDLCEALLPDNVRSAVDVLCEALPPIATATAGMERREFAHFPIVIEYPAGSIKSGIGADGEVWSRIVTTDYGYVAVDRDGGDGEPVDVYLGPDEDAPWAFWIYQLNHDGEFDEWKLMLGFDNEAEARACYNANVLPELCGGIRMQSAALVRGMFGLLQDGDADRTLRILSNLVALPGKTEALHARKMIPYQSENGEQRFVLDVVLEPTDVAPGITTDSDGDVYTAVEIEGAQQLYSEHFWGNFGDLHKMIASQRCILLESYIVRCDAAGIFINGQFVRRGSWLIAYRVVDDELWEDIKAGRVNGISMGGFLRREPIRRVA